MRNLVAPRMGVLFGVMLLACGCTADSRTRTTLKTGYQALEARQYDAALAAADQQLARSPRGPGAAEALYLRGRVLEQRPAASQNEARNNLRAAQRAYLEALDQRPAPKLEGDIRSSLANVLYFQDDYASALREWTSAYGKLKNPDTKSWVLYRTGLCQQRLGQFDEADKTFAEVQQKYPNTVPAQRAREHAGARGFMLQLATFASPSTAQNTMESLRRDGVNPTAAADGRGRTVVRIGPLSSYQQALTLKQRYQDRFADALILP